MLMLFPGIIVSIGIMVSHNHQPPAVFFAVFSAPLLALLPIAQAITFLTAHTVRFEFSLWLSAFIWIALIAVFHRMSPRLSLKAREYTSVGIGLLNAACIPWSLLSLFKGISC